MVQLFLVVRKAKNRETGLKIASISSFSTSQISASAIFLDMKVLQVVKAGGGGHDGPTPIGWKPWTKGTSALGRKRPSPADL